jgi:hypothetical protein
MKTIIKVEKEVDVESVSVSVAVRYGTEDIPADFPMRKGDTWSARINIDAGTILDWPQGQSGRLSMKVCDQGTYRLLDAAGLVIAERENDYVPNHLIPGEYGDYIDLDIDETGRIVNWPKRPSLEDFFPDL